MGEDDGQQLVRGLHHIQPAMPRAEEEAARRFYVEVLGFQEVETPDHLKARGGCWFRSASVHRHLGVDPDLRPASKAHPAFVVSSRARIRERLEAAGYAVVSDAQLLGSERFYSVDPFGNRLEFLEPA